MRILLFLGLLTHQLYPITAQQDEIQDPIKNFEKLWSEFDLRYANFELKQVDWKQAYEQYRPQINDRTDNKKLFEVSCMMLQELNDGHVTIAPDFTENDIECGPPYTFQLEETFNTDDKLRQFERVIQATRIKNGFTETTKWDLSEESNFQYCTSPSLGYLRMDEMTEKITFGKYKSAIDNAMQSFQNKKGIIIDLRFNGGGWDHAAYQLASRLTPKGEMLCHFERTRKKGKQGFTPLKLKTVKSKGKKQYIGEIVILTSDFTASAAEVFVLLMKDLPNVTIIGDRTEGIFSDMFEFNLPNKWTVTLSHQQFFSRDTVNYEGKGIAPDIKILNSEENLKTQSDVVLETAIQFLLKK